MLSHFVNATAARGGYVIPHTIVTYLLGHLLRLLRTGDGPAEADAAAALLRLLEAAAVDGGEAADARRAQLLAPHLRLVPELVRCAAGDAVDGRPAPKAAARVCAMAALAELAGWRALPEAYRRAIGRSVPLFAELGAAAELADETMAFHSRRLLERYFALKQSGPA
jgi:hypothetical protein